MIVDLIVPGRFLCRHLRYSISPDRKLFSMLKMSSYNPPAPSASSGALRSLKPDFPEQGQPLAAGEYETEARTVLNDEFSVSPPQLTAVREQEDSINYGLLGNDDWDEPSGRNGSFADFVRENNSYRVVDPYTNEEAPGHTYFNQRTRTNKNESSTSIVYFQLTPFCHFTQCLCI